MALKLGCLLGILLTVFTSFGGNDGGGGGLTISSEFELLGKELVNTAKSKQFTLGEVSYLNYLTIVEAIQKNQIIVRSSDITNQTEIVYDNDQTTILITHNWNLLLLNEKLEIIANAYSKLVLSQVQIKNSSLSVINLVRNLRNLFPETIGNFIKNNKNDIFGNNILTNGPLPKLQNDFLDLSLDLSRAQTFDELKDITNNFLLSPLQLEILAILLNIEIQQRPL